MAKPDSSGVGPELSWWSTYERMQGIVNAAHWAAFALVVASVARTWGDWTRLLDANLAVGLAVAAFAIVRFAAPGTPLPFPFTGTPNLGFGLSDGGVRDYRIGWRLTSAVPGDPGFEVSLDATRTEAANDNAPPEHGIGFRVTARW